MEINPFLLTTDNRLIALDAKVNFDDNAMFGIRNHGSARPQRGRALEIEASKLI